MIGLARGWDRGSGPRALLACPPGEQHDLSLITFGLDLREHGWRITFLGADAPLVTIEQTAATLQPDLIVLAAIDAAQFTPLTKELRNLATQFRLALACAGDVDALVRDVGAIHLNDGPIEAAGAVASRDRPDARAGSSTAD